MIVRDQEDTVEDNDSRATLLKNYAGRRVVISNSGIYTRAVAVNTVFGRQRNEFDFGIGYGEDPARVERVFAKPMRGVEGLLADPAPEALPWKSNESAADHRLHCLCMILR